MNAIDVLKDICLPILVISIMFSMGLTLKKQDFLFVLKNTRVVSIGLFFQLAIVPFIAFIIVKTLSTDPIMSIGLLLVALCPSSSMSNMFTYIAKANVALSVSLTVISCFVVPFTLPIVLSWALGHILSESQQIELPVLKTMMTLLLINITPIFIGMAIKSNREKLADKLEPYMKKFSITFFAVIITAYIILDLENLSSLFGRAWIICTAMCIVTLGIGHFASRLFTKDFRDSVTITIEMAFQNGTLAYFIAGNILKNNDMMIPIIVHGLIILVLGSVYTYVMGKKISRIKSQTPQAL
ncbi:bile acid:sodium symporter family protein [Bacteriovoracaceae bacterium]|nr:bile acid:sodium symporter family protein [Bacteriovoracaceae bacterium]